MDQFAHPQDVLEGVVAVGQLALRDGVILAPTFTYAWPVDQAVPFDDLLREIDEAASELSESGGYQ
jgi:hypothetical protein